ncbi:MAG: ester cyclase [Polyangiaceae bacterium]
MRTDLATTFFAALSVAALSVALLAACAPETVAPPPAPPVDWHSFNQAAKVATGPIAPTAKEQAVAQAYISALNSPGFAQLGPLLSDDAHVSFPGLDDARGRTSVVHTHDVLFGSFDQRRFVTTRVWRTASEQTVEWTMAGTQTRDWMRVPVTGKSVTIKGLTLLFTQDDGSVSDVHIYFDLAATRSQLGAGPKELAGLPAPVMPSGAPQTIDQNGQDMDNVRVVRASLDALENSENGYVGAFTDDVEVHTLERVSPSKGKTARQAYFRAMHKAIGELDTTLENGWGIARFAVVEYTIAGEQLGPVGWVPMQKDAVVRLHVADVCELRDGRISQVWRYDNPGEISEPSP